MGIRHLNVVYGFWAISLYEFLGVKGITTSLSALLRPWRYLGSKCSFFKCATTSWVKKGVLVLGFHHKLCLLELSLEAVQTLEVVPVPLARSFSPAALQLILGIAGVPGKHLVGFSNTYCSLKNAIHYSAIYFLCVQDSQGIFWSSVEDPKAVEFNGLFVKRRLWTRVVSNVSISVLGNQYLCVP